MSIHEEPSSGFDYASLPPGVAQALRSHTADIRTRVRNQMTEFIATGIAVDRVPERLEMARRLGADHVMAFRITIWCGRFGT
jgi:hypothetical protein